MMEANRQSIQNLGFDIDKELEMTHNKASNEIASASPEPGIEEEKQVNILEVIESNEKKNEAIPESVVQ